MNYTEIIDLSSAKERFMGNWRMFSKFLFQFPDRSMFGELEEKIAGGDAKEGFEAAHTMKGIVGNLSLKKLAEKLHPVVESLRGGSLPDKDMWADFSAAYTETVDAIKTLQKENTPLF